MHKDSAPLFSQAIPRLIIAFSLCLFASAWNAHANVPGGILSGSNAPVTVTDGGTTVTLSNGIASIVITKTDASIHTISYTYNNSGTTATNQMLGGGGDTDDLYWLENAGSFLAGPFTETVVANTGTYAQISLVYASATNGIMEVDYSMLQGSPGFYATAILTHRAQDPVIYITLRPNIYAGGEFNWMSVDANRNKLMQVGGGTTVVCPTSPVENYLWTSGIYQGHYEDKYKYTSDLYSLPAWGWSSVGSSGSNVGMWIVSASHEYYPGGPMDRSLMEHIGTTMLNTITGNYYGLAGDGNLQAGESWTKTYGPYFYYFNNTPTSVTDPVQASQTLYADALAQGAAEQTAWPYSWYINSNYTPASGRGTVTGTMIISDSGNPNASAAGLWVGVVQQPSVTYDTVYDFQEWCRPYEFWVRTNASGSFTIPNVIAGSNYTLYAFGPGAPGTFMSQAQTGGAAPLIIATPSAPFSVAVTGGSTTALGTVTWTPTRYAPTVFEIGYPDRTARKFRHGDDYWVGDIGPSPTSPSSVWTKFMEYPVDFPNGPNYIVGTSRWTTDWNFIQPSVYSSTATWNPSSSNITFTLPSGTSLSGSASIYLGLAADYDGAIIFTVNGTNLGSVSGLTATPNASVPTSGYYVGYATADASIREGVNGAFSDERLTFPASLLNTGTTPNVINVGIRQVGGSYFADHAMYDYIRLELTGYVPPAPASVAAFAGNNSALISWPVTPGATSYNILRSVTNGSGYASIATGVTGPVCGSGPSNATWLDTTATNGTAYYYVIQSVNPTGTSANSSQSSGVTPSSSVSTTAPAAPTGVTATGTAGSVTVSWTASPGANYYTVQRSTLYNNGGTLLSGLVTTAETYNTLSTITLSNTTTGASYTDSSPTNGSTYSYTVQATNAAGSSTTSTSAIATPLAAAPTSAPGLTATPGTGEITLNWTAVPGATGYDLEVGTASGGPYTYITTVSSLTYLDASLAYNTKYYYVVAANNSGGTSANSAEASATTAPAAPTGLTATPGNTQVTLTWSALSYATGYAVQRATVSGGPYTAVGTSVGPSYTDNALTNGTTYYYVVAAEDASGTGADSTQASATPIATLPVAPTNLTASATNGDILLLWNASSGATSYQLYRSTANGGPFSTYGRTVTTNTVTDTDVLGGITYYYVVAALNSAGTGAYSNQASANTSGAPSVIWTGSASSAWDTVTANWVTSGGSAGTYSDGADVIFPDTATTGTVDLAVNVSPASVNFSNSSLAYTFNSSSTGIEGTVGVIKSGAASVTLTGAQSYSGGTTISDGIYALGADSSETASTMESPGVVGAGGTDAALGSASSPVLVDSGGELRFGGQGGPTAYTYITPNPITIDGGSIYSIDGVQELTGTLTINSGGASLLTVWSKKNLEINSGFSGSGNVTIDDWQASGDTAGGAVLVQTASNAYSGAITINAPSTGFLGGVLEVTNNTALTNATIIDNNTSATGLTFSVTTPQIGALGGAGNIPLTRTGGGGGNNSVSLSAGADGAWTTYSGVLSGGGGLTKTGTGTMILTGSNTYIGGTTVTGGILKILGAIGSSSSMTVGSGGVLYLAGGTLHIAGSITNNGIVKLSGTPALSLSGAFTNNGVLDLIDGPQTLPTGFVNTGTVLTANSVQVQQAAVSGSGFSVTIDGYAQHTYQLQSSQSLTAPIPWTNVGAAQTGTGGPLIFTDPSATGAKGFYKVQISP